MTLNQRRHHTVSKIIERHGISSMIELGCSEGELLLRMSRAECVDLLVGVDIDKEVIKRASKNVVTEPIQNDIQWHRKK